MFTVYYLQLFDHIAACMAEFMKENNMDGNKTLPLGFTFSFPCQQDGLTVGKLITWTKGFKVKLQLIPNQLAD